MAKTRRDLVEQEIVRLEEQSVTLERDWRRIPYLAVFVLAAVPAHLIWGPTAAFYAILCAPCLVITALYLVGVRRSENEQQIEELRGQLEKMGGPAAGVTPA